MFGVSCQPPILANHLNHHYKRYKGFMEHYYEKKVEEAKAQAAFEAQVKHQLKTEERFVNYFSQFDPDSVESFIENYAAQKYIWHLYVKNYWHFAENKQSKWYKLAIQALNQIAVKKVYNQMCCWLKGRVKYDYIQISDEWDYWLKNPLLFKDMAPISQQEIDAYIQYVESLPVEYDYYPHSSLDFYTPMFMELPTDMEDDLSQKEETIDDDEEEDYDKWCRYYDKIFALEDLHEGAAARLKKEDYYLSSLSEQESINDPPIVETPYVQKPYLEYERSQELIERYVKEYETYDNKLAFEGLSWYYEVWATDESTESTIEHLDSAEEYVPVAANDDWRKGLSNAYQMYFNQKIIDALPAVYEEYCLLLAHNLDFEDWGYPLMEKDDEYIETKKRRILEARKLLNEPENFDF